MVNNISFYNRLLGLEALERIDYNYLHDLLSLTARLIEVVAKDSVNIKREVVLMGGGKVLEMESEKIYNDGIAQGVETGKNEQKKTFVQNLLRKSFSLSEICMLAECDEEFVKRVEKMMIG